MCEEKEKSCRCNGEDNCCCANNGNAAMSYEALEEAYDCARKSFCIADRNYTDFLRAFKNSVVDILSRFPSMSDSGVMKYLEEEVKHINNPCEERINNVKAVASLIYLINEMSCNSVNLNVVQNLLNFKPVSPLTLKDDEFNEIHIVAERKHFQNKRNGKVFKDIIDGEVKYSCVEGLKLNTVSNVDIVDKTNLNTVETVYDYNSSCGCFYVYDPQDGTWSVTSSSQFIKRGCGFVDEEFIVPSIELYDSSDKENDYYALIVNKNDIPYTFYKYYDFNTREADEDDKTVIENLVQMSAEKLFFQTPAKAKLFTDAYEADGSIFIKTEFLKGRTVVERALEAAGEYSEFLRKEHFTEDTILLEYTEVSDKVREIIKNLLAEYGIVLGKL